MRPFILIGIVLLCASSAVADINYYYKIDLVYDYGNWSYKNIDVQPSQQLLQTPEGKYIAEVVSYDNIILNLTFFAMPLTIFYDVADPETGALVDGGVITLNQSQMVLHVPYYSNAKEINIYDQELIRRLTIDTSSFTSPYAKEEILKEKTFEEKVQKELQQKEAAITATPPGILILLGLAAGLLVVVMLIVMVIFIKRRKS